MSRHISSTLRRYLKADRFLFFSLTVMRACSYCRIYNFFCVIAFESSYCERYFRSYLECELASSDAKIKRFFKKKRAVYFRDCCDLCEDNPLSQIIPGCYKEIARFRQS
jgi:hypothetical protein